MGVSILVLSKKWMVIGCKGMLGHTVMRRLGATAVGIDLPECDITDREAVFEVIQREKPAVILNCAAYTRVDDAEKEEVLATRINGDAVGYLAECAKEVNAYFLTISTDYVFPGQGQRPYYEDAFLGPRSAYGRSKAAGEERVQQIGGRWAIVRIQWLYGEGGNNFIDTIARLAKEKPELKVVDDQVGAPTWTEDMSQILIDIARLQAEGIYHAANSGYASWYEVARFVVDQLALDCEIKPCSSEEFPRPAIRPQNSRLSLGKVVAAVGANAPSLAGGARGVPEEVIGIGPCFDARARFVFI